MLRNEAENDGEGAVQRVRAVPLTAELAVELRRLSVTLAQEPLIATNDEWLDQAAEVDDSISFALLAGNEPVGLMSFIEPGELDAEDLEEFIPGCAFLWRLMIDARFQGRGYGRQALLLACDIARERGFAGMSLTTMDTEQGNALPLYLANGFSPTGRRVHDEIELVRTWAGDTAAA